MVMTTHLKIGLAQLNPTVGAVIGNLAKARDAVTKLREADLVLFPELFIAGYPPEDLVLRPAFVAACKTAVEELAKEFAEGPAILIGLPWRDGVTSFTTPSLCFPAAGIETVRHKFDLPNYGVFDEKRVFNARPRPRPCCGQGRAHWCADLRGHLDRGDLRDAG